MSVVSRRVRSTPVRSSSETWDEIVSLLAPDGESDAHKELLSVSGIACSLIASDAMEDAAVVCTGSGPRVRIYCLYGEDAITGDDANEASLQQSPTEDEWKLSLPSPAPDLNWVNQELKKKSSRITARDKSEKLGEQASQGSAKAATASVNTEAFLNS